MARINVKLWIGCGWVRINGVFHKVLMETVCALNIQKRGSSAPIRTPLPFDLA